MEKKKAEQSRARRSEASDSTWRLIGTRGRIGSVGLSKKIWRRGGVDYISGRERPRGRCEHEGGRGDSGTGGWDFGIWRGASKINTRVKT